MAEAPVDELAASLNPPEAPKPKRGRPPGSGKVKAGTMTIPQLRAALLEFLSTAGALAGFANQYDGLVILNNAEALTDVYVRAAESNRAIKLALEALVTGGTVGALVLVTAKVAVPILANHGRVVAPIPVIAMLAGEIGLPPNLDGNGARPMFPPTEGDETIYVVPEYPFPDQPAATPAPPRSVGEALAGDGFSASGPPSGGVDTADEFAHGLGEVDGLGDETELP